MNEITVGIIGVVLLFLFLMLRMPVAWTMAFVGFLGIIYLQGFDVALAVIGRIPFRKVTSYTLTIIPLFTLMGYFASYSGLSRDMFNAAYKWLGRIPGGLALASIASCAGFAAACGSNVATAATMGALVMPEAKRYKYDGGFMGATVASGATLGILIPPSVILILYGILTEQSIGQLFIAGILPGIALALLMMIAVFIQVRLQPELAPRAPKTGFREKLASLKGVVAIGALFTLAIGGIAVGLFTPTEGGGIGAFGAFLILCASRRLTWKTFTGALVVTVKITGMIFLLIIGTFIFGHFIAVSKIPMSIAAFIEGLSVHPYVSFAFIMVIYLILGCVIESLSMFLLTTPIFYPVVVEFLGFDAIWFGVIMVLVVGMAVITPPVGINVLIVQRVDPDVPMIAIFRRIFPFLLAMIICIALLLVYPQIALFLPRIVSM